MRKETAILIVAGLIGWWHYGCTQRSQGELQEKARALTERIRVRDSAIVGLMLQAQKKEKAYRVKRAVYTADSSAHAAAPTPATAEKVIRSCSVLVTDCEGQKRDLANIIFQKDSLLAQKDTLLTLERQRHPGRFSCLAGGGGSNKGLAVGFFCGVRLFSN